MKRNTLLLLAASLAAGPFTAALADDPDTSAPTRAEEAEDKKPDQMSETGKAVSDATITAKVKSKLLADRSTQGLKINVDTKDGVVTLTGNVKSTAEKNAAEQIAEGTENVKDVRNELTVGKG